MKITNLDTKYTEKPPTGEKWDFENPRHKKRLIEIVTMRYGAWCMRCGLPHYTLGLHHLRPRGQVHPNTLLVDKIEGIVFYRDDPHNLRFVCHSGFNCHDWIHNSTNRQFVLSKRFLIRPEAYTN